MTEKWHNGTKIESEVMKDQNNQWERERDRKTERKEKAEFSWNFSVGNLKQFNNNIRN